MMAPSPVSDESSSTEGAVLREFVDQAIAEKRLPTMSPRSALLSQSSMQAPTADARSSEIASGPMDSGRQLRTRSTESRRKRGMEVARPSTLAQLMDVDLSRKDPKDEVMRLRDILKTVELHSVLEARRAQELERANHEAERRLQHFVETQFREKQEALKAQQEVRLVQLQLQNAQEEIERKQREMKSIERQRDQAKADADKEREKARKFREQTFAAAARDEGRRLGYQAGLDYASQERRMMAARKSANLSVSHRTTARRADTVESKSSVRSDKGKRRAIEQPASLANEVPFQRPRRSQHEPALAISTSLEPYPAVPNDILLSPENEMSPSQLPLRTLPPAFETYPVRGPSTTAGPSHSTPLRTYVPPPESEMHREEPLPPRTSNQHLRTTEIPPQSKTPAIQIYEIDIPSAEQLNREYSYSQENSSDAIHQPTRDQWVTASSFQERRASRAPPVSELPPPQPRPQPQPSRPAPMPQQTPTRAVKFTNILSRPSLSKTREQASSWYRSLSWRKKSKAVIDPIPEEGTPPIGAGPLSGSMADDSQPPTATEPPETTESQEMYGGPEPAPGSWYQPKQSFMPPNGPASMRSGYSRMRPISDAASVSTRVSQFDLLATPHAPAAMSVRSGKEGPRRLKEKESYLSAINEDPASRGNTPAAAAERAPQAPEENMRSMASVMSQPNFGHHPLQQQSSYRTFDSSAQNKQRSRRPPPSIAVPDHDQELEPFGVAYNRGAVANGYQPYMGADLNRRPSRISEKTTPGSGSIGIDIVPPSGFAPDPVRSPPHTGRNHLSPYHTYHAAAPLFKQSIQSLRTQGSSRPEPPVPERPPSAAASRRKSKQSFNGYADPPDRDQPSRASNAQPRPPSASSRPASAMNNRSHDHLNSYNEADYTRTPHHSSQHQSRPESVRSSGPRKFVQPYANASQTSLSNLNGNGGVQGQPRNASSSRLVLASPVHRVASNTSMRSQGSYARYDPTGYVDPAFWPTDGIPPPPPAEERHVDGYFDHGVPPRAASANSGLSYISDPNQ